MKNRILRGFRALIVTLIVVVAMAAPTLISGSASAQTVVVRVDGIGGSTSPAGQGNGWGSNAYLYLQDGLSQAATLLAGQNPPSRVEVWVRGSSTGISYRPDQGSGFSANDPNATFALHDKVFLHGGFDTSDTLVTDADPVANVTILTGEIDTASESDNSRHVVTADDTDINLTNCRLDGFTITRGNAVDEFGSGLGGGGILIADSADLRVDRCIITDNRSGNGGYGAGIKVHGSSPVITRCVISNNKNLDNEVLYGGGIVVEEFSGTSNNPVRILDCTISGNRAAHGGGIAVKQTSYALIVNCVITGNSIDPLQLNSAPYGGGIGVDRSAAVATIVNCTFSDNTAVRGGAFAQWSNGTATSSLLNCILWDDNGTTDGDEIFLDNGGGGLTVDRCQVKNLTSSVGVADPGSGITITNSHDTDPLFVDPDGPDNDPDTYGDNNYHLQCGSPSIDLSLDSVIPTDDFDLNGNGVTSERTPDRDLAWRVIGSAADRGAYEITGVCCPGDTNESGAVDVDDLLSVVNGWGANPSHAGNVAPNPCPDNVVDVNDLLAVINGWGNCSDHCPGDGFVEGGVPQSYTDCQNACSGYSGEAWQACMQACFKVLCEQGQTEYCED